MQSMSVTMGVHEDIVEIMTIIGRQDILGSSI